MQFRDLNVLAAVLVVAISRPCSALDIALVDHNGLPLAGAVVEYAKQAGLSASTVFTMDQINKQFSPEILVVPTGAQVEFPNSDDIRHHVYSFSAAKPFELRLYKGRPENPITVSQPGVIVLGCNIHDAMVGYIYVANNAVARSDPSGIVRLPDIDLSPEISVWHPLQAGSPEQRRKLSMAELSANAGRITITTEQRQAPDTFETRFGDVR